MPTVLGCRFSSRNITFRAAFPPTPMKEHVCGSSHQLQEGQRPLVPQADEPGLNPRLKVHHWKGDVKA